MYMIINYPTQIVAPTKRAFKISQMFEFVSSTKNFESWVAPKLGGHSGFYNLKPL